MQIPEISSKQKTAHKIISFFSLCVGFLGCLKLCINLSLPDLNGKACYTRKVNSKKEGTNINPHSTFARAYYL